MAHVVSQAGVPVVLMHMQGTPETQEPSIDWNWLLHEN